MTDHATVFGVCENKCFVEVSPKSDTDAVEARVEALETEIGDTDIKTRLDAIDGEVDALQANDTAQNASISALQTQVAELAKSTGNRVMYCIIKESGFKTIRVSISGAISGDTSLEDDGYEKCKCYYYSLGDFDTLSTWKRSIRDGCVIDFSYYYSYNSYLSSSYTYSVMGSQITDAEFDAIFNSYNDYVAFSGTFKIDYTIFGVSYYQDNSNHMIVGKGTLTIEDGKIVSKTFEKINNKVYSNTSLFDFFVMLDYSTVTRV